MLYLDTVSSGIPDWGGKAYSFVDWHRMIIISEN